MGWEGEAQEDGTTRILVLGPPTVLNVQQPGVLDHPGAIPSTTTPDPPVPRTPCSHSPQAPQLSSRTCARYSCSSAMRARSRCSTCGWAAGRVESACSRLVAGLAAE